MKDDDDRTMRHWIEKECARRASEYYKAKVAYEAVHKWRDEIDAGKPSSLCESSYQSWLWRQPRHDQ